MNNYINDFNDTILFYYKELRKKQYNPLSKEEEHELLAKVRLEGCINAKKKILSANLRFVFRCAKRYKGCGVPIEDLIAEGNQGLIKAIDKFNLDYDIKFYTYASWWIRQSIQECVRLNNLKKQHETYEEDELETQVFTGCLNDGEDEQVKKYETVLSNEEDEEERMKRIHDRKTIKKLMEKLTKREQFILSSYFGLENESMTLEEIGDELKLSKERVRQVKEKCLKKLRSEALVLSL